MIFRRLAQIAAVFLGLLIAAPAQATLLSSTGEFTITSAGGTGSKSFAHGLGTTPQLIIFFSNRVAAGSTDADAHLMFGAASDSTHEFCATAFSEDAVPTSDASQYESSSASVCIMALNGTNALDMLADFTSFDDTNFTINVSDAPSADTIVQFIAIAGSPAIDVTVGSFTVPAATGNTSVTGLSFQAKLAIFLGAFGDDATANNGAQFSIGAATSSTARWSFGLGAQDGAAAENSREFLSTSTCFNLPFTGSDAIDYAFDFVSFNSDGFTVNVTNAPALAKTTGYILLGGADFLTAVGTDTRKITSTGTKTTSGLGTITASQLLLVGSNATTADTAATSFKSSIGAAASTSTERVVAAASDDASDSTITARSTGSAQIIRTITPTTPTTVAEADWDSAANDTFTLNWTTVDGTAGLFGFIAMQDTGTPASATYPGWVGGGWN